MAKVLVVDDERSFANVAADELKDEGFEADAALSYTEAIKKLEGKQYDVVSLDIMMRIEPDEDVDRKEANHGSLTGLLIYKELRRRWPDVKVVICSVRASDENELVALKSGVDRRTRILSKPVRLAEYIAAIREAVGG